MLLSKCLKIAVQLGTEVRHFHFCPFFLIAVLVIRVVLHALLITFFPKPVPILAAERGYRSGGL